MTRFFEFWSGKPGSRRTRWGQAPEMDPVIQTHAFLLVDDVRKLTDASDPWRLRVGDWRVRFTRDTEQYVEFDVPSAALRRGGREDWAIIDGPTSSIGRMRGVTEMPSARCITVIACRR